MTEQNTNPENKPKTSDNNGSGIIGKLIFLGALVAAYHFILRPQMKKWGTRENEAEHKLEGDDIITHPNLTMTHAIDIDAPPEVVWLWLAQMGRGGSGFYNLDILSNKGIPSADMIRTDLPELGVDMMLDNGFRVLRLEKNAHIVIGNFMLPTPLGSTYDITQSYTIESLPNQHTRLVSRLRIYSFDVIGMAHNLIFEPIYFIQSLTQLNAIRDRAQSSKNYVVLSKTEPAPKEKSNGRKASASTPA